MINTFETKEINEIDIRKKIIDILPEVIDSLSGDFGRFSYSINQIHSSTDIRDMHMQWCTLPEWAVRWIVALKKTNKTSNDRHFYHVDFMVYNNVLIPLGTAASMKKNEFFVYPLSPWKNKIPINDFVTETLPEHITLFRVLSEEEAKMFSENNTKELWSTHQLFWQEKAIHTSIHNITDEFIQEEAYKKLIGFEFSKEDIKKLLHSGKAQLGTYDSVFSDRKTNSPLPFDLELVFDQHAFDDLVQGYKKWAKKTGKTYLDNPFFTKRFPHEIATQTQEEISKTLDKEK